MFLNLNNNCSFEGRLVKDVEYSTINGKNGAVPKAKFTIVVDKVMTKQQKEYAKNNNQPTADFITCECIGQKADFINSYFTKGSSIKVLATFRTYSFESNDGSGKKYAYSFDVVDAGFVVADYSEGNGNSNSSGNKNNNNSNNNNGGSSYNNSDFAPVDDGDLPF